MSYTKFTDSKPVISDTGLQVVNTTRTNLMALRDAAVCGNLVDWDMDASGGTVARPTRLTYSKGNERVRLNLTWGSSGNSEGAPTRIVVQYSSNSGSSYQTIGTKTITYTTGGYVTRTRWT